MTLRMPDELLNLAVRWRVFVVLLLFLGFGCSGNDWRRDQSGGFSRVSPAPAADEIEPNSSNATSEDPQADDQLDAAAADTTTTGSQQEAPGGSTLPTTIAPSAQRPTETPQVVVPDIPSPPAADNVLANSLTFTVNSDFTNKVDVVVVVDNSRASSYYSRVTHGLNTLVKAFKNHPEAKFTVITGKKPSSSSTQITACLSPANNYEIRNLFTLTPGADGYQHINCAVDALSDLSVLMKFFREKYLAGKRLDGVFSRAGAIKAFLLVSHEGAPPNHESRFAESVEDLWNKDLIRFYHYSALLASQGSVEYEWTDSSSTKIATRFPWLATGDRSFKYAYRTFTWYTRDGSQYKRYNSYYSSNARFTKVYSNLSKNYQGQGYDLSATTQISDWAPSLSGIAGYHKFARRVYELGEWSAETNLSISAVELDGSVLSAGDYSLDTSGVIPALKLADGVDVKEGDILKVSKN